jgi:hypothetical protein
VSLDDDDMKHEKILEIEYSWKRKEGSMKVIGT